MIAAAFQKTIIPEGLGFLRSCDFLCPSSIFSDLLPFQVVVNWWFGARWFGSMGYPLWKDRYLGVPRFESQTTGAHTTNQPLPSLKLTFPHLKMDGFTSQKMILSFLRWSFFFFRGEFLFVSGSCSWLLFFLPVPFGFLYLYCGSTPQVGHWWWQTFTFEPSMQAGWPEVGDAFFSSQKKRDFHYKKLGGIAQISNHVTQINKDITKISKMYCYTPSEGVWYCIITRRWLSPLPGEVVQFDLRIFLKGVETWTHQLENPGIKNFGVEKKSRFLFLPECFNVWWCSVLINLWCDGVGWISHRYMLDHFLCYYPKDLVGWYVWMSRCKDFNCLEVMSAPSQVRCQDL